MIGTFDIRVNAAKPNFPLPPFYAFINSPSQVRVVNVPRSIGDWEITAVQLTANYPDNQSASVSCTLTGGCWHGTLPASTATGTSTNGFTVTASGVKEDGTTAVTGYVLGKGDVYILDTDGTITVGSTTYYVHLVDSQPEAPKKGDLCLIDSVYKLYNGTAWVELGSVASVDWSAITNKPSTFAPSAHASSHGSSGDDPITPASIGAASATDLAVKRDKTDLAVYERPYLPWTINGEELTYSNGLWSSVSYSMWYEATAQGWMCSDTATGRTLGSPMTSEDALDVWLTDTLGEVSVEATRTGVYGDPTATGDTLALTSAITTHNASAAAHSALFAAKRDTDDNACHETTDGFSPWFATPPSGYTFGDAQPVFDSTTSKWTWYVEGTGVAVDAESGTSTEDATSATFTFEDSGTKTFTATRFAAVESTEGENYVTKSYVASQFSSDNTSLRADNIRMTAADATTIKAYIDAKLGEIETALTRILGGN